MWKKGEREEVMGSMRCAMHGNGKYKPSPMIRLYHFNIMCEKNIYRNTKRTHENSKCDN